MSEPHVSAYDQMFIDAFGRGIEQLPPGLPALVKGLLDKVHDEVVSKIESYIHDEMATNAALALRDEAAKVASSMLADALAGDDKTIRTLFGFNDYYMKYSYIGLGKPTQWALIDAIVARRPDVFLDERLKQRDREIAELKQDVKRLHERINYLVEQQGLSA